uniref:Elongation factor 1-beta n=1 Tax=uncultured marine group II/III euryarchaeote KM3_31_G10 TaxID=1456433 RepID=A0A075H2E8_9EURY|nr:translation elongation factor EF-1 subunit beta [uncultured marine group II/III euryarchaeote KM3_31_G10]
MSRSDEASVVGIKEFRTFAPDAASKDPEVIYLGEVGVRYKIMAHPDSDVSADVIAAEISAMESDVGVVHGVETKPLAFGLMFVEAFCVIEEGDGTVDAFEDAMREIDGVGEIQVIEIGRLM